MDAVRVRVRVVGEERDVRHPGLGLVVPDEQEVHLNDDVRAIIGANLNDARTRELLDGLGREELATVLVLGVLDGGGQRVVLELDRANHGRGLPGLDQVRGGPGDPAPAERVQVLVRA